MSIDISEYKTLYIKTARDLIRTMSESLEQLRKDRCDEKAIGNFHRAAHSFKSQSLVMGYTKSGLAARMLEQIFRDMKDELTCPTDQLMPIIEHTVNKFSDSINSIENQLGELDLTEETEQLNTLTAIPVI
ncbi:hypothetical protein BH09PAT2_BH09PAT2_07060 [soil metagenome]